MRTQNKIKNNHMHSQNPGSLFSGLVDATGPATAADLRQMAFSVTDSVVHRSNTHTHCHGISVSSNITKSKTRANTLHAKTQKNSNSMDSVDKKILSEVVNYLCVCCNLQPHS